MDAIEDSVGGVGGGGGGCAACGPVWEDVNGSMLGAAESGFPNNVATAGAAGAAAGRGAAAATFGGAEMSLSLLRRGSESALAATALELSGVLRGQEYCARTADAAGADAGFATGGAAVRTGGAGADPADATGGGSCSSSPKREAEAEIPLSSGFGEEMPRSAKRSDAVRDIPGR